MGEPGAQSDDGRARAEQATPRRSCGITLLALSFALGIAIGWHQPVPWVWPWLSIAAAAIAVSAITYFHRGVRLRLVMLHIAAIALGAAWLTMRQHYVAPNDLAARVGDEPRLVRIDGVALAPPVTRQYTQGSLATFDYRRPVTVFPMRVRAMLARDGRVIPARGEVLVRVDEPVAPFRAGDRVQALGFLTAPGGPSNPGQFDYRRLARSRGQAAALSVSSRELLTVSPADHGNIVNTWLDWRDHAQRRACAWLLTDLPSTDRGQRDALLAALLLGQRDRGLGGLDDRFRRVGLAHLLAISGLHLGVLVGFVLLLLRWMGQARRLHGLIIIAIVLVYLFLIEVRLPVLRAGVMTIAVGAGMIMGRRWRIRGLLALSGILLLTWRPDQLFDAGFQLSYGVVLGLIHFVPRIRERWFGRPDRAAGSSAEMIGQWMKSALVVALVAWLVATPLMVYHFGMVSPLAVPLAVVALPITALLLATGYVKMLLTLLLPSAAMLMGAVLTVMADLLISIVTTIDELPGTVLHVPTPPTIWTLAALALVTAWAMDWLRRLRGAPLAGLAALSIWLLWPVLPIHHRPPLRVDMLAVGDGSCYVLRSAGETMVYDAGSTTDLNAGDRVLVPALRRLGVRHIDTIAISHPNLDHYSAVLELVDAFGVDRICVTPDFSELARDEPFGPLAHLLDGLTRRRVPVNELAAGSTLSLGGANLTVLHPMPDDRFERRNDGSLVIAVEAAGRRLLFTGDIGPEAIDRLRQRHPHLTADIVEMPHHGSFNEAAAEFIADLTPRVLMQSTGYARWKNDRWGNISTQAERLVTARDGACIVIIDDDGEITCHRFREPAALPTATP